MRSFEPGTCVGRYRVLRLLGAGGMGQVYAAGDLGLGRKVDSSLSTPSASRALCGSGLRGPFWGIAPLSRALLTSAARFAQLRDSSSLM